MHSEFRRMPAERARHAKRLGHVQPVNEPFASPLVFAKDATTSTTTTTQTTAKTTTSTTPTTSAASSTVKLSSSVSSASASLSTSSQALTSSASLQSTFSAPSATIPSTSSPAATGLPSSSNTTSQSVVFVTATSTPSPTATTINNNASSASSQGLSGGAVGGIVAASVVVSLAFFIFIVRKTYLRRRQKRRFTWPAGNVFNDTKPLPPAPVDDFSEKPTSVKHSPMSPFEAHGQSVYASPPQPPIQRMQSPFTGYAGPAPPPASYNNPMSMYSQPPPSLIPGDSVVAMARAAAGVDSYPAPAPTPRFRIASEAVVKRAFIPTLPDELSVTAGERIRVLAQYDDAWALCANGRGEQGMVPQECLDQHVASDQGDWRNARRASSLVSDGRRV